MKIASISWEGFALPFKSPYVTSGGQALSKYGLLVFLRASDGLEGVGEASPVGPGSLAQVRRLAGLLETNAASLVGGAFDPAEDSFPGFNLDPALDFGLETAYLDLLGKAQGKSISALMGWRPQRLPVNAIIASDSPEEAAAEAVAALRQGFTTLKLKVGQALRRNIALVSHVRSAVGPAVRLRIDPNQGWTVAGAVDAIKRLSSFGLEYVEQPVAADDLAGMAEVRRATGVSIAADEALRSPADVHRIVEAKAADLLIVKAARLGGLRGSLRTIEMAAHEGVPSVVTSSLESGVGLAASAHLASALTAHPFAHGLGTGLLYANDLTAQPLLPTGGVLATPAGPGLGVILDKVKLQKYAIGISGALGAAG
ncbi:MAG: mandelate racemase/muconate lactonizing enzyme family protein [Chloroflexi bacterium]|nr:mandelate racemase/muconate lactonizing enzyme family protein [Chloroflexota bacterium]